MSAAKNGQPQEKATTEVARRSALDEIVPEVMGGASAFDESALRSLDSFESALAMVQEAHGEVVDASDTLGDGFALIDNKDELVGLPMVLMEWAFRDGDFGRAYVSVRAVAKTRTGMLKVIFNDGGTGIAEQLARVTKDTGKTGGMVVGKGLRRSDYDVEIDGRQSSASTYYLDTAR
jgi:hypothetical protein